MIDNNQLYTSKRRKNLTAQHSCIFNLCMTKWHNEGIWGIARGRVAAIEGYVLKQGEGDLHNGIIKYYLS